MPILSVRSLDVFYGKAHILKGVNIDVAGGSITALIGPNGSGKTTLLKAISGIVKPARGSISYDGLDLTGREPHEIVGIGVVHVPEGRRLFPYLSVYENLKLGSYIGRARERFSENLERVLSIFPVLRERLWQKAGTLSGGEQQMLAIARAVMAEPKVLLIDEPSLGLAPKMVDMVFKHIEELRSGEGISILLAEQNAAKAFEISDQVYVLEIGRVIRSGKPSELVGDEEVRKAYLGI